MGDGENVANNLENSQRERADNEELSDDCISEYDEDSAPWAHTPDAILLNIFQYLTPKELTIVGEVCRSWNRISHDEMLWKYLFYREYEIDPDVGIMPGKTSWLGEFKRLADHSPMLETEVLKEHSNQVLHVSFSHNGKMFATCSKDGYVLVWNSEYPVSVKYYHDMKTFSWKYTQFSQFNSSDTLLLVSGVHFGAPQTTSGEITVFRLAPGFDLQCRIVNKPYDIFGTWYSEQYLISGNLYWLAHLVSTSYLWLNKASQESTSEHIPIMTQLFKFYNCNSSSVRSITIANCLTPAPNESGSEKEHNVPSSSKSVVNERYPKSRKSVCTNNNETEDMNGHAAHLYTSAGVNPGQHIHNRRSAKLERMTCGCHNEKKTSKWKDDSESEESSATEECDTGAVAGAVKNPDKYLIFTTSSKTYTNHQIGFKRIKDFTFPTRLDPGPSLRERLEQREREKKNQESPDAVHTDWLDYESVADKFDKVDHLIDLHGHIIGMALSPDHRYLYVNTRPWPVGYVITNPLQPPPIAQEIDIHVIDLVTLKEVGKMLRAHKAYTSNNECFFIFLDVCNEYVASGAEDKHGYLWDRHYGVCLAKFPHSDVVNSVAFNPQNPEMLVTTSDDYNIKVWRSRAMVRKLGLNETSFRRAMEVQKRRRFRKSSCSVD